MGQGRLEGISRIHPGYIRPEGPLLRCYIRSWKSLISGDDERMIASHFLAIRSCSPRIRSWPNSSSRPPMAEWPCKFRLSFCGSSEKSPLVIEFRLEGTVIGKNGGALQGQVLKLKTIGVRPF
jgi:hypothetical protein